MEKEDWEHSTLNRQNDLGLFISFVLILAPVILAQVFGWRWAAVCWLLFAVIGLIDLVRYLRSPDSEWAWEWWSVVRVAFFLLGGVFVVGKCLARPLNRHWGWPD